MNKTTLIIGIALILQGCGASSPWEDGGDWPEVKYAGDKAREYFNTTNNDYQVLVVDDDNTRFGMCHAAVGNCLILHSVIIHTDTKEYDCQQVLHELGHYYLLIQTGDYDYNHTNIEFFGDINTQGYVSTACESWNHE